MKISTTVFVLVLSTSLVSCSKDSQESTPQPSPQEESGPSDVSQSLGAEVSIVTPAAPSEVKPFEAILANLVAESSDDSIGPVKEEEAPAEENPRLEETEVAKGCEASGDFVDADGATQSAVQALVDDNCRVPAEETAQQS